MPGKFRAEFHLPVRHKTFRNSISKKNGRKLSRTKLSAFLILFHKTQLLPRRFPMKKTFIVHEFKDSFGERLRKKLQRGFFDINDQLVNFTLKYLNNELTVFFP